MEVATRKIPVLTIVDLEVDDPRLLPAVYPVLRELRPHVLPEEFNEIYEEGYPQGLRFSAAFLAKGEDGQATGEECVGVAGWRIIALTFCKRKLYVDDLVTTESARSLGVGKALIAHLEAKAREAKCTAISLDSGCQRQQAHKFYFREGLVITDFHFHKPLPTKA
eukprot:TRINITY_DN3567_c0_g1_i1.p1 TRINITY_DN3567_c0_g1~~TRINITY_DN3567_c0_g1_i1.p1  ORF type:complete len:165 (+),score=22.97 TRINITY_DN3567_c0_g1_i1:341-835(+)